MPDILIAFDSFKGSLTALEACSALERGIKKAGFKTTTCTLLPMADGGEGTLDCLQTARAGKWNQHHLHVAAGFQKSCKSLSFGKNEVAMEVAEAVGIIDLNNTSPDVMSRHSGPAGKMLKDLIENGAQKIAIGLGGSCTSDGGLGLLCELGLSLLDQATKPIEPFPKNLEHVASITWNPSVDFNQLEINMLNDVENPLCGDHGACAIYGPQKGLTQNQIQPLDQQIKRIYQMIESKLDKNIMTQPGAGAAGGLGAALYVLGAKAKAGAEVLIELTQLEQKVTQTDLVITGEGRSDAQTLEGKLPKRIADLAAKLSKPVLLVSGGIDIESHDRLCKVFDGVYSISNGPNDLQTALQKSEQLLENFGYSIVKTLKLS
jgi:glycerate kinase